MSRSSLPGSGISGVAAALAPLLLAACLPSAPSAMGASPAAMPTCPSDPMGAPMDMSYSTAAGDSTIGAVPQLWSKEYFNAGDTCVGDIHDFGSDGKLATRVDNNDSLGIAAIGKDGEGRLCKAKVFKASGVEPIYVYRVWSSDVPNNEFGSWWMLESPMGSKAAFMKTSGACASFGKFDRLTKCKLRKEVQFAVGPGQNRQCGEGATGKSAVNQVYIPVNAENPMSMWFEGCESAIDNPLTERAQ